MAWDGTERRKAFRNFQPQTAFEGFVANELVNLKDRLNALPCRIDSERIGILEQKVSNIQGKATIIGAAAGFIAAWFTGKFGK